MADRPWSEDDLHISDAWRRWRLGVDLDEYNGRWDRQAAAGCPVHGEADLVERLGGSVVLDAGCGTGRVAVELARRGRRVTGVDNDPDMLALARVKPEPVSWVLADLATVSLGERFDVAVLAGNVLPFVDPPRRPETVANIARHLVAGGQLVIGTAAEPGCRFGDIDRWCTTAGLERVAEYATWDEDPYDGGGYRVSVHRAG